MTKLLTLLFAVAIATPCFSQELNVPTGKTFSYTSHMVGTGSNKYDELNTYAFRSLGKNADGDNVFECKLIRTVDNYHGRRTEAEINTYNIKDLNIDNSGVLKPLALLNRPFTVVISKKGKVLKIEGLDKIIDDAAKRWKLEPGIKNQLVQHTGNYDYYLQKMFFQMPDDATPTADGWKTKNGATYKIAKTNDPQLAVINVNAESPKAPVKPNPQGKFLNISSTSGDITNETVEYVLDAKTGLIQNAVRKRDFTVNYSSVKDQIKDRYEQHIGTATEGSKPDTAWANMAAVLSGWSDAFKTGDGYDQAKMQAYFKTNDAKFKTDPYYNINKLNKLQKIKSDEGRKIYDSTLLAIPDQYIYMKNDLHIAFMNKFDNLVEHNAQKAYATAKVFAKTYALRNWLNETTAQNFLNNAPQDDQRRDTILKTLVLMSNDKEPKLHDVATPLYLWASAKKNPKNIELLLKNAAKFDALNVQTFNWGKGGRYGLLLYGMLLDADKKAAAEQMLNNTINKLSKAANDTLYAERLEDRPILAHAYYLKYQAEKAANRPDASQYLSLAAQYSPAGPAEKVMTSYYDRHFLKSKESYRQDLLEQLFNSGDEKEALKTFATHISAQPESLMEMKALYEKKFPGKDFKTIFLADVVGNWKDAPGFKLKDLENKDHQLKDYLGKWVVIDFWGTWCGPCVAEVPGIDSFNKELVNDPKAGFLSIACQDWTDMVIPFMKKNNYTFPVLMSDNYIQGKYKVDGYPYKVLISPNGKWITIDRSKDWKQVLKNFSSI